MMSKLVPQDMFDLAAKLDDLKTQLVVNTSAEKVPEIIRSLEETLDPWKSYLSNAAPQEASCTFENIKLFQTHDRTRQQVINSVYALSVKITELARAWALEMCLKCISDTFSYFNTPADIAHFVTAIDEAKNNCLKNAFGEEKRPLEVLFKRFECDMTGWED